MDSKLRGPLFLVILALSQNSPATADPSPLPNPVLSRTPTQILAEVTWTTIPVRVDVLKDNNGTRVDLDKGDAVAVIKAANKILEKVRVTLEFDRREHFADDVSDGGNQDLDIDKKEAQKLFGPIGKKMAAKAKEGGFEGKGYGLVFAKTLYGTPGLLGLTPHQAVLSISYIARNGKNGARSLDQLGQAVAHEICHAFTLGPFHKITANRIADKLGHDDTDNKSLVWVPARDGSNDLTDIQIAEVASEKSSQTRGVTKKVNLAPGARAGAQTVSAQLVRIAHDGWADDSLDAPGQAVDLLIGDLTVDEPRTSLFVRITLADSIPPDSTHLNFQVVLDTDHQTASGGTFGSFTGIDKIVAVTFTGQYPFAAPVGAASAAVVDVATSGSTSIGGPVVGRATGMVDADSAVVVDTLAMQAVIEVSVPMSLLDVTAGQVRYGVRSWIGSTPMARRLVGGGPMPDETAPRVLDLDLLEQPSLIASPTQGAPGDSITLTGSNFSFLRPILIQVGGDSTAVFLTDGGGELQGRIALPALGGQYVVTAIDSAAGQFDFEIVQVVPTTGVEFDGAAPARLSLRTVGPNPTFPAARLTVEFDLPRPSLVVLSWFDLAGRQCADPFTATFPAGTHRLQLAPRVGIGAGVYVLRIRAGGAEATKRVVVLD